MRSEFLRPLFRLLPSLLRLFAAVAACVAVLMVATGPVLPSLVSAHGSDHGHACESHRDLHAAGGETEQPERNAPSHDEHDPNCHCPCHAPLAVTPVLRWMPGEPLVGIQMQLHADERAGDGPAFDFDQPPKLLS